jgi:hypothetical protein
MVGAGLQVRDRAFKDDYASFSHDARSLLRNLFLDFDSYPIVFDIVKR